MIFEIIDFYHRRKKAFVSIVVIMASTIIAMTFSMLYKTYNYPKELLKIDSVCNFNPNKAKELLKAYEEKHDINEETKWYLRLVSLKSIIKANKKIDNDKEAKTLIMHYEDNGDKSLLPEVYYCAGCAYNSLMDIPQANKYFFKGIKALSGNKDEKLLALFYYQLGQNFSAQELHNEAYYWEAKSLALNKRMRDTTRCIYDYMNIAWTLGNLGNPDKALKVMFRARKLAEYSNNKSTISEIDCQITNHYLEWGILNKAKEYISKAIQEKESNRSELFSVALETYMRLGEIDKIREFSDSTILHGNVYGKRFVYWCLLEQSVKDNKLSHTSEYMHLYKTYDDSIKKITVAEASAKANALYNYKLREEENMQLLKENSDKTLLIIILSTASIISLLSAYIIYTNIKRQKLQTEKRYNMLTEQLENFKEMSADNILKKEQEIEKLKKQLQENKHEEIINIINAKEAELKALNSHKKQIDNCIRKIKGTDVYKEIYDILKGYNNKIFTKWNDLEIAVYESFPNFETNLHNLGKLNFTELKVCLLTRIGLSVKDISTITCTSKSSIYSTNQRLYYKKFGKYAASSDWIEFIRTIY